MSSDNRSYQEIIFEILQSQARTEESVRSIQQEITLLRAEMNKTEQAQSERLESLEEKVSLHDTLVKAALFVTATLFTAVASGIVP